MKPYGICLFALSAVLIFSCGKSQDKKQIQSSKLTDNIRINLGVDVPTKYLTSMVVTATDAGGVGSAITATLNDIIGGDTIGQTAILTSDDSYKTWTWSGSLPATYMPKN